MTRASIPALAALVLLGACGDGPPADDGTGTAGRWRHVRLTGVEEASGLAVLDGQLLVVSSGDRRVLHAAALADLEAAEDGARIATREIPLAVDATSHLGGAERFSGRGYRLGDLWDQEVDFQGLAALAPDQVFVADRIYRVGYAGRLERAPDGTFRALRVHRAFVIPGGDRSAADAADWRDKGAPLAGLASTQGTRETADLYAIEAEGEAGIDDAVRVHLFDRFGMPIGAFSVRLGAPEGAAPLDVAALAHDGTRLLLLRGAGRGLLRTFRSGGWGDELDAGGAVPGPDVPGAGPWRGMTADERGTLFLVGGGSEAVVAWRSS